MFVGRERKGEERNDQQRGVARHVLQFELGAIDLETDTRLPRRRGQDDDYDAGDEQQINAAAHGKPYRQPRFADGRDETVRAVVPDIDGDKDREDHARYDCGLEPEIPRRPEEVDAVQKPQEQRRIAERRTARRRYWRRER